MTESRQIAKQAKRQKYTAYDITEEQLFPKFTNSEMNTILKLLPPEDSIHFFVTVFKTKNIKPGCSVHPNDNPDKFEQILKDNSIPYRYNDNGLFFIGEIEKLPQHIHKITDTDSLTQEEKRKVGEFYGVPEEDNFYREENEYTTTQPKENVHIRPHEKEYLRLVPWRCKPTQNGLCRALEEGQYYELIVQNLIQKYSNHENEIKRKLSEIKVRSSKFYG